MGKDDSFEEPVPERDEILSAAEKEKIRAQARADILAAKKEDAKKKLLAAETQRLRNEEGLTTGNTHSDQIVSVTIDLPLFTPAIVINSQAYHHGRTYAVPRHVGDTLRDQMFRSWQHQDTIDGKSKSEAIAQKHVADLYQVGTKGTVISAKAG